MYLEDGGTALKVRSVCWVELHLWPVPKPTL
jgi:hypothetical protein